MKKSLFLFLLVLFAAACSPATNTNIVAPPIEQGKDPACVKKCKGKEKECVDGARSASSRIYERCYEGYELCVGACRPK